ncbi:hypothetical protein ACFVXE_08720 [Streptomyces sp. NPDC058231]|uniref:hypothetical protein n=1 Tax=Streptomyces sp. NPDC058231 TaxID=3346392 RepID=UPI0036E8C590
MSGAETQGGRAARRGAGTGAGGRAGRGRRAHRRRGRKALLAFLGVVLAAGALSLARLAIEPSGDDGASDYVREAVDATTEPAPDPSSSHALADPAPVGSPSVVPATDAHATGTSRPGSSAVNGGGAPGGEGSGAPTATSPADGATSSTDPSSAPSPSRTPGDPTGTGQPTGNPTPPQNPAPPSPTPRPTRTQTCWFLIFCS